MGEMNRYTVELVRGAWVVIDKHYPREIVEDFGSDGEAASRHADWMNS